jgi:predicted RNA polymerase sigma factor
VFTAYHPVLSPEARVALTLRVLGGLTTDEIARAFLVGEPTIAQRIVRAEFERAASITRNTRKREFLLARAAAQGNE